MRDGVWFCFFFQAEDGIRDGRVTGVQTCALPIFPRRPRSTHRRWPATGTVMPSGPMLGTHQPHRPPHTTGLSLDSAFGWKRTAPTDAGLDDGADHVGVHKRIRLWWDAQPNGSRLSCGALTKDSFLNLRAPSASSAC